MDNNTWQLYSSMSGWQTAAQKLDVATGKALAKADKSIAKGSTPSEAALQAFNTVLKTMSKPAVRKFGGCDSEPRDVLGIKIGRHMRITHKSIVAVNRFGDVS